LGVRAADVCAYVEDARFIDSYRELAQIGNLDAESDSGIRCANWDGMFRTNSNLDAFFVNGMPCVDEAKDCAKNCDCEGD
jgi:hypothetical protein